MHRACTGTLHPERARRARREAARRTRTAPAPEADNDQLGVAGPGGGADDEPGGRDLAARPDDLPLEPGGSPSRICAASGRPAMPARGECSPVDASSAAMAASRALNVSMLAFSSPSLPPRRASGAARLSWHAGRRAPARNAGLTPGTGKGRRSPASCRSGKQTMIVLTTRPANSTAQVGAHADDIAARHPPPALIIGTCFRACWSLLGEWPIRSPLLRLLYRL